MNCFCYWASLLVRAEFLTLRNEGVGILYFYDHWQILCKDLKQQYRYLIVLFCVCILSLCPNDLSTSMSRTVSVSLSPWTHTHTHTAVYFDLLWLNPTYSMSVLVCLDVNECDKKPCSQECANIYGSYQCYCRQGYFLKEDGRTCEGIFYQDHQV